MQRIEIAPTKSNLRKVKSDLEFAYEGFDLLNQKREILVLEIMKTIRSVKGIESEMITALDELYIRYRNAAMDSGAEVLAMKALSEKTDYTLESGRLKLMGISVPVFIFKPGIPELNSSLAGTSHSYDMIKKGDFSVIKLIVNYASLAKKIFLLSTELKKVQRKVNALEKIFIPSYEDTRKYISDRLEEIEREEIYIKKLIGRRSEKG